MLAELATEIIPRSNTLSIQRVLPHVLCPECRSASFKMYADGSTELSVLTHGVIVCQSCHHCIRFEDGILEVLKEKPDHLSPAQRSNFFLPVAAGYQKCWRTWCMHMMCGTSFPNEKEAALLISSLQLSSLPSSGIILDLGTSHGFYAVAIAQALERMQSDALVLAIDISKPMLQRAVQRAEEAGVLHRIIFILGDAEALPLADSTVCRVVSGGSLNEFTRPDVAMSEAARTTQTDALFFNMFLHRTSWTAPLLSLIATLSGLHFHAAGTYNALFEKTGWRVDLAETHGIVIFARLKK